MFFSDQKSAIGDHHSSMFLRSEDREDCRVMIADFGFLIAGLVVQESGGREVRMGICTLRFG
jgi:hypothetical protein